MPICKRKNKQQHKTQTTNKPTTTATFCNNYNVFVSSKTTTKSAVSWERYSLTACLPFLATTTTKQLSDLWLCVLARFLMKKAAQRANRSYSQEATPAWATTTAIITRVVVRQVGLHVLLLVVVVWYGLVDFYILCD